MNLRRRIYEPKNRFHAATIRSLRVYKNEPTLNKILYYPEIYHHASFYDPQFYGVSIAASL
jgi:hypothetical protein